MNISPFRLLFFFLLSTLPSVLAFSQVKHDDSFQVDYVLRVEEAIYSSACRARLSALVNGEL